MRKPLCLLLYLMLFNGDPCPLAADGVPAERSAQRYVLEKMSRHDVLFLGTTHRQPEMPAFLIDLLPALHGARVTHLVLEIAADQQIPLDRFLTTGRGLETIQLHPAIDSPGYRRLLQALADLPPAPSAPCPAPWPSTSSRTLPTGTWA